MNYSKMYIDNNWIKVPLCGNGDKLYHYTTVEGVKGIIENKQFWVTKSDFLNDKLEFKYDTEIILEVCKYHIKDSKIQNKFTDYVIEEIKKIDDNAKSLLTGYYVISFSKKQDSALLWSEYSDFMGYCIEFNFEKLLNGINKGEELFWHGSVLYDREEQIECMKKTMMIDIQKRIKEGYDDLEDLFNSESSVCEKSLRILAQDMAVFCSLYAMFFKKECFANEEEYRFVFAVNHEKNIEVNKLSTKVMNFRHDNQVLIPYITISYENDEIMPVESILVGPKNNSDLAIKGMKYFLKKEHLEIPVLESDIPLRY